MSWTFVKNCLLLNYLGQGAWLLQHQGAPTGEHHLFFEIIPRWGLLPAIGLCALATIIASQDLISGSFKLIIEALRLDFWPKVKVSYPTDLRGQAYVPSLNWILCAGYIGVVLPGDLVRIDFHLDFRVNHAINYMFRQVVTDLVAAGQLDITSRYASLRSEKQIGDFQFVILNRTLPYAQALSSWQRLVARVAGALRWLGISQQQSFELDNSSLTIENVPLHTPERPELQLARI